MKSSAAPIGLDRLLSAAVIIILACNLVVTMAVQKGADAAATSKRLVLIHRHSTVNATYVSESFWKFIAVFEPNMQPGNIEFVMVDGE